MSKQMSDKTSRAIMRLLSRPGFYSLRIIRRGSDIHLEGVPVGDDAVPQGVVVRHGGESTLLDAVACMADSVSWNGGEPPDQLAEAAEAEVRPMVWAGGNRHTVKIWRWATDGSNVRAWREKLGIYAPDIFVPGHLPRPTIDPAEMDTIETCKEIWND